MEILSIENGSEEHIHEEVAKAVAGVLREFNPQDAQDVFNSVSQRLSEDPEQTKLNILTVWAENPAIGIYGAVGQVAIDSLREEALDKWRELEYNLAQQFGDFNLDGHWVAIRKHRLVAADISLDALRNSPRAPSHVYTPTENPYENPVRKSSDTVFRVLPRDVVFI